MTDDEIRQKNREERSKALPDELASLSSTGRKIKVRCGTNDIMLLTLTRV